MAEAALIGAIIIFFLYLIIVTIFLKIALVILGAKKTDFGEVFVTSLIIAIIAALFSFFGGFIGLLLAIVGIILIIYFIGQRHDIGFCLAIIVVILAIVVYIIVVMIVVAILALFGLAFSLI